MKRDIRNSVFLKAICYILIPIFVIIILLSAIYTEYIIEYPEMLTKSKFYETNRFASIYESKVNTIVYNTNNAKRSYTKIENTEEEIYYNSYNITSKMITYLIIDNETQEIYTNVNITEKTDSLTEIKDLIINEQNLYWNYEGKENIVNTNIENENLKSIKYSQLYEELKEGKYDIYTCLNNEQHEVFLENIIFNLAQKMKWIPTIAIPILIIIIIVMIVYLCISIGHKRGNKEIYLNKVDKWPIEITGIISIILIIFICYFASEINFGIRLSEKIELIVIANLFIIFYIVLYIILAAITTIIIKKIKTGTLIKSSLLYQIVNSILKFCQKIYDTTTRNIELNIKIVLYFIGTTLISVILFNMEGVGLLLLIAFWGYILYKIFKKIDEFKLVKNTTKQIYNGDFEQKIDETLVKGELKELSTYINDIAGGFSNAIQESIKSERLKTELITNVSHDIKTPLTSIINYVDLLKQENIQNEKAKEYIRILDNKSQRLKKLTEDLIEASKVSSGNVKFNIEKINVGELINQSIGEFEDKFKEKGLEIIPNLPNEEIDINADSRYMYRIIENIYSNISKYSLENSRVYIDVKLKEQKVYISFKNISKQKLNITVDELMERFVRGDKSRNTEGSGLGISISKSLTELQNGKFNIQVDGDLFKVELIFKQYKNKEG